MTTQQQVTAHIETIMGEQHQTRTGTREECIAWITAHCHAVVAEYGGETEYTGDDTPDMLMWIVTEGGDDPEPLVTAWID